MSSLETHSGRLFEIRTSAGWRLLDLGRRVGICVPLPFISAPLSLGHVVVLWDGATVCSALTSAVGHGSPAGSEPASRAPSRDDAVALSLLGCVAVLGAAVIVLRRPGCFLSRS